MFKKIILLSMIVIFTSLVAQTPFVVFDFNNENTNPSTGTGSIALIGGATAGYAAGFTGNPDRALNTTNYPEANASPETAGIQVDVSTAAYSNIHISWNHKNSNTAANRLRLQYTINGNDWLNFEANESNATNTTGGNSIGFDNGLFISNSDAWYVRSANFTDIQGANNNPDFAVRFVTAFPSGSNSYHASNPTGTYGTGGTVRYDNLTFLHQDANTVASPVASPAGGTYDSLIYVELSTSTPQANIFYTTDGSDPSAATGELYTEPIPLNSTTTLKFRAEKTGMTPSAVVTENYVFPVVVNSLAEVRALTPGTGSLITINSEVIVSFTQSFRGQKFIQDQTAGLLIDDFSGVINTQYQIGDGITGLSGTLSVFGNMLQLVPAADPGAPSSTGNNILPEVITTSDFLNNFNQYQSQLVIINNIHFVNPTGNFEVGTVYSLSDNTNQINFRTTFYDADYIETAIPSEPFSLIGILNSRTDGNYITPRSLADFAPTGNFDTVYPINSHKLIGNYPNPFNPNTSIAFELKNQTFANLSIYNVRGQKVITLVNETLNAGQHAINWNGKDENNKDMATGVYYYKLSTPDTIQVKKAILMK